MSFSEINFLAVFVAAVGAWLTGAVWYGVLGKQWMAALGKTKAELMGPNGKLNPLPFVISFFADLVMVAMLSALTYTDGPVTLGFMLFSAVALWFGFALTTMATNNAYGGRKLMLTLIDAGHWLAALLVAAAILRAFD